MIRSYTVDELEQMSGITKRTISDYIAKGLLAGPSHRGRGARYPQADADALRVVPRIRMLMKKEFPTVDSVASFLRQLSRDELGDLACQHSEKQLVLEVRRIRIRVLLATLLPKLTPERLKTVVDSLSPDQIHSIDKGQVQLGAILDLAELFRESGEDMTLTEAEFETGFPASGALVGARDGQNHFETVIEQAEAALIDRRRADSKLRLVRPSRPVADNETETETESQTLANRLVDIADRLDRLEKMLAEGAS